MKDIIIRSISGIIFIGILIGSILASQYYLRICLGVFSVISLFEFSRMVDKEAKLLTRILFISLGIIIYLALSEIFELPLNVRVLMIVSPLMVLWTKSLWDKQDALNRIAFGTFGLIYCVLPYVMMTWINDFDMEGRSYYLLYLFLIVWSNDTFAYLIGRFFGRHKLLERISPKKTWEGTIGGISFSMLVGLAIHYYTGEALLFWLVSSIIISVAAIIGDLFESLIKRTVGVKDSGNSIPGHGGVLDRFDAALFVAPVFLTWCFIYFR